MAVVTEESSTGRLRRTRGSRQGPKVVGGAKSHGVSAGNCMRRREIRTRG